MSISRINPFYAARFRRAATVPQPTAPLRVLDLFSGIGGFSLGFERAGMTTAAFCEIEPYCRRILNKHWPHMPVYPDIKQLTARRLHHDHLDRIDLICGGYPCQPFSIAGRRRGTQDPRHLWPEMYRLIRELRPRWVVCENVAGHIECGLDAVLDDLEHAGYTCWPFVIPACAVGAPHRRDRVWIIAHAPGVRPQRTLGRQERPLAQELPAAPVRWDLPSPFTCRSDDGIPFLVERLTALGNAVVPQIPELIGRAILAYEASALTQLAGVAV